VIRALVLGIVQGLTEFLPVSSSGHLVLAERLLRFDPPGVLLELLLHLATLGAVVFLFRRDLLRLARSLFRREETEARRELLFLAVASVPVALLGYFLQASVEAAFSSLLVVGISLLATGGLLLLASHVAPAARRGRIRLRDSVAVGLAQGAALLPGVSRSGATLAAGILCGVEAKAAARFSFLLSIPAILGAAALKLPQALRAPTASELDWPALALAAAIAGLVAAAAIRGLLAALERGKLKWFGVYCLVVGLVTVVLASLA